jgi:hypothetical protein
MYGLYTNNVKTNHTISEMLTIVNMLGIKFGSLDLYEVVQSLDHPPTTLEVYVLTLNV